MALRYLAGKLRVPAGAVLRRAEGTRGVASRSPQAGSQVGAGQEVTPEMWSNEDLRKIARRNEFMLRFIIAAQSERERYEKLEALCVSGGVLLGLFASVLLVRYENRNGGKISKMVFGVRTE